MDTELKTKHFVLLGINILAMVAFGMHFYSRANYEFIIYIAAIALFLILLAISITKVPYTDATLVGLTVWAIMHMAGGAIHIKGVLLYEMILIPLSKTYPIFRYDQLVHIWGFGAATLAMFCVLMPILKKDLGRHIALSVIVIMAGLGVGAFNEIVEALVTAVVPKTGVGGYVNTALDLISNFIGAIAAMVYIRIRYLTYDSQR